jgi:hypothetical protein
MFEILHGSEKYFKFRIRGVFNLKHTLMEAIQFELIMYAPLDFLSSTFTNSTCKGQAWWAASINFAGISWWHVRQVELGSMDIKWKDQ